MNVPHKFDPWTYFCLKCGEAMEHAFDFETSCHATENVIAISHLRCAARLDSLVQEVLNKP